MGLLLLLGCAMANASDDVGLGQERVDKQSLNHQAIDKGHIDKERIEKERIEKQASDDLAQQRQLYSEALELMGRGQATAAANLSPLPLPCLRRAGRRFALLTASTGQPISAAV